MASLFKNKIVIILVVIVVGGGLWYMFSSSSSAPADPLTAMGSTTPDATGGANDSIVQTLLALRAITLSGDVFSDPAFQGLKDFSTQIVPEPVGRTDPFSPLSPSAAATSQTTQNAQMFLPKK